LFRPANLNPTVKTAFLPNPVSLFSGSAGFLLALIGPDKPLAAAIGKFTHSLLRGYLRGPSWSIPPLSVRRLTECFARRSPSQVVSITAVTRILLHIFYTYQRFLP